MKRVIEPRSGSSQAHASVRALEGLFTAAARDGLIERRYVIAGLPVRMRFAGAAMLERIGPSFQHLADDAGDGASELRVNVWDSASTLTNAPPVLGAALQSDGTGPIYYYDAEGVRAISRWGTLAAYDSQTGEAWFWAPSPDEMLSWDWASPLRAILHWWLGRFGILQVHGGAVGIADGGVLIVGRGGSGKSTTSLASLVGGLRYAGDDFVAVRPGPVPYVHSLYSSGKLESDHIARFPVLAAVVANRERLPEEKAVIYADDVDGATTTAGFPLRAVLIPHFAGERETRLAPASAATALTALAPSTIFQLHPPQRLSLAVMGEIVRSVPCFSLELGTDLAEIPGTIAMFLQDA